MSARGTRPTARRSGKQAGKAPGKAAAGTRELARGKRAAQRRAARRQAVRAGAAARTQTTLSLLAAGRRALGRVPAGARVCALVAFLNAACWSLATPAFQVPDEPDHFAYVQQLAENGSLPSSSLHGYSPEENQALEDLRNSSVRFRPEGRPISHRSEQEKLQRDLAGPLPRQGNGGVGFSASEPPLYYALETIPYGLGSKGSILERLELMRLESALMGALTALFVFLFLSEALPGVRWAWTAGGLGVAFAPLLGFASGGVTPDALLFAVCAALFYCLARAFRRGLTQRSAIAIGILIAVGFLTKLNFVGLAPGAILALVLLARRQARACGPQAYRRSLAPALAIATGPVTLYALVHLLSSHPGLGIVSAGVAPGDHRSLSGELSYVWQFYLPALPWMHSDFGEIFTTRQIWFRDLVGMYGWGDTFFPRWVYDVALLPAALIAGLCIRALIAGRSALRRRAGELSAYALMSVGVLALVGAAGYTEFPNTLAEYAQPRYVLPMVALWGAVLALAARGAGRRWGPIAGVLLVVLVFAHDVFSQLQLIARYYG